MAKVNWARRFDPPIKLPDCRKLRTLKDAAEYVLAIPPEVQVETEWQHAANSLKNAALRDIAWMWFSRPKMMRALLGPDSPPIGNPEGEKGA